MFSLFPCNNEIGVVAFFSFKCLPAVFDYFFRIDSRQAVTD